MANDEMVNEVINIHNQSHNTNFHIQGIEREKIRSILTILLEQLFREGHLKH